MSEPEIVAGDAADDVQIHRVGPEADREAFLRRMPNAIVACHRREAAPNLAPLWYLWTGEEFWISTLTWTARVKNLRRDPRMSLCIDDPISGEYVTAYGTCRIIEDDTVREKTLALIREIPRARRTCCRTGSGSRTTA